MKKIVIQIFFLIILFSATKTVFPEKIPACMLNFKYGKERNVLIVEKSSQKLFIYSNYDTEPIKVLNITTGQKTGQKYFEGDLKTPEGIYYFKRTLSGEVLPKINDYGEKAFVMNFPNPIDRLENRGGSGIWLHGAFDIQKVRTANSSKGCVVMTNNDLNTVSKYIFLKETPIFIYENIEYLDTEEIIKKRNKFLMHLKKWKNAWENKDLETYIDSYSTLFSYNKMNLSTFKNYKKRLNKIYKFIKIRLSDLTLYAFNNYYLVSFNQLYISDKNNFYSKKIQYWKIYGNTPKIANETSMSLPTPDKIEISKGNYITINQYRRNILNEQKQNTTIIYPSNISIEKIEKISNKITLSINNNSKNKFKIIPVLHLKRENDSQYRTIDHINLKNGVPQNLDYAVPLKSSVKVGIGSASYNYINSITIFVFDYSGNYRQILTFFIKK